MPGSIVLAESGRLRAGVVTQRHASAVEEYAADELRRHLCQMVGAGTLVTPGTVVPPGSMFLGAPGKVKRMLSAHEQASLRESAAHYVEISAHYRAEGWGKR